MARNALGRHAEWLHLVAELLLLEMHYCKNM